MRYKERQISLVFIVILIGILVILLVSYIYQLGDNPISLSWLLGMSLLFTLSLLLFFQMITSVDNKQIRISFGIGLINKRIYINKIEQVKIVRNKWYYGFGIRILKNGWLYNIKGLDAVELKMKNSSSVVRIGTADSNKLKKEIEMKL